MVTRVRKTELTADDLIAVQLSNRQQHGEYVTYDALSSNGVDTYTVTLRGGDPVGCTCPATVRDCRHAKAAQFEEAWSSPVAVAVGHDIMQDLNAHIVDSLPELAAIADEIEAAEREYTWCPDGYVKYVSIHGHPDAPMTQSDFCYIATFGDRAYQQARKAAEQALYRDMYPEDYGYYGDVA